LQSDKNARTAVEQVLVLAAASLFFSGCASPTEATEQHDSAHHMGRAIQSIVGGSTSGADQDAVVVLARFEDGARAGLCTATLIAGNLAITARHCVSATDSAAACGPDGTPVVGAMLHGDRDPASLAVFVTKGGVAPDTTMDVGASAHGRALVVDDATTICNHDVAFVILDKELTAPIAPIRLAAPIATDTLTAVGFGITEVGALPASRMQRTGVSLVGIGPMPFPDDGRYGVGDGELLVGESACSGDSGSPILSKSGAVVGVASRAGNGQARDPNNAASTCMGATAHAVYTELGTNATLATRAFKEAGATPWLEGDPDPRIVPGNPPAAGAGASSGAIGAGRTAQAGHNVSNVGTGTGTATSTAPSAEEASAGESGGGCTASGTPVRGAVEDALGIAAALLLLLRFRSGRREKTRPSIIPSPRSDRKHALVRDAEREAERIPYVDIGIRESLASMSEINIRESVPSIPDDH
jgi:hypothetical protein